jgi:leucyl aminopeptidase
MRQIIEVDVKTRTVDLVKCKTDLLVVGCFSDGTVLDKTVKVLDEKLHGAIRRLTKLGDFKGAPKTSAIVYTNGQIPAERVMLIGLGERKKADLDTLRKAAATAANQAVNMKLKSVSLALHKAFDGKLAPAAMGKALGEGAYFGSYRYDEFVTQSDDGRLGSLKVEVVDPDAKQT